MQQKTVKIKPRREKHEKNDDSNGDRDNSEVWMILDVLLENEIGQQKKGCMQKIEKRKRIKTMIAIMAII